MCNLKQEEFLNIRFKENEIEKECWKELIGELSNSDLQPHVTLGKLLPLTMLKIAEKKTEIYQKHLDCEVEKQKEIYANDETLQNLRNAHEEFKNGNISHAKYWLTIDTLLFNNNAKRDYILVNDEWVRNHSEEEIKL